jgi:hypothetical protein
MHGSGTTTSRAIRRHPGVRQFANDFTNEVLSRIAEQVIQKIESRPPRKKHTPKKAKKQYLSLTRNHTRHRTPSIIRRMRRR